MSWYARLIMIWIAAAFLIGIIAVLAKTSRRVRLLIVLTFIVGLTATFWIPLELIGRPKPADWEWAMRDLPEAEIHGMYLREGQGIWLMLLVPNKDHKLEPRLYEFPWNMKMAENLMQAAQGAAQGNRPLMLGHPFKGAKGFFTRGGRGRGRGNGQGNGNGPGGNFDNSVEDRDPPMAYPKPVEADPPKPPPTDGPTIFDHGDSNDSGNTGGTTNGGDDGDQ